LIRLITLLKRQVSGSLGINKSR